MVNKRKTAGTSKEGETKTRKIKSVSTPLTSETTFSAPLPTSSFQFCDNNVFGAEIIPTQAEERQGKETNKLFSNLFIPFTKTQKNSMAMSEDLCKMLELEREVVIPINTIKSEPTQTLNTEHFYLFETLKKEKDSKLKDFSMPKIIEDTLKNIDLIDIEGCRMIYILLKKFALDQKQNALHLPFNGKIIKEYSGMSNSFDIEFDIQSIPEDCVKMIYLFTLKHLTVMSENAERI